MGRGVLVVDEILKPLDELLREIEGQLIAGRVIQWVGDPEHRLKTLRDRLAARIEDRDATDYLDILQERVAEWVSRNFGSQPAHRPLLGSLEEIGELADSSLLLIIPLLKMLVSGGKLAHAQLKKEQGIRKGEERFKSDAADAVGDIVIYLADYCDKSGLSLQDCVERTWTTVRERDWTKRPETG